MKSHCHSQCGDLPDFKTLEMLEARLTSLLVTKSKFSLSRMPLRTPLSPTLRPPNKSGKVGQKRYVQSQSVQPRRGFVAIGKWLWVGVTSSVTIFVSFKYLGSFAKVQHSSSAEDATDYKVTEESFEQAAKELRALLGAERVDSNPANLISHSSTQWSPAPNPATDKPALILCPQSTEEVSKIAKICNAYSVPMTPFAGGTSLEGALAATHGGVCIDFKNMKSIIEVRPRDLDVTVQAGLCWQDLNEYLDKHHGLFFPPDPGPGACIGGMVSTNCSGPNAYRYGTMKDWVVSLTIVLADGTVVRTRGNGRPRKTSAGYDLTRLFVGSSGTLGIVTEAVLKITSRPQNERVGVAAFSSLQTAVDTVVKLAQKGVPLGAIEMLDEVYMYAINQAGYTDRKWREVPTLFFKFSGPTLAGVEEQIQLVKDVSQEGERNCLSFEVAETDDDIESLWAARKTALWSYLALKDNPDVDEFVSSDVAVPISRLGDAIEYTQERLKATGMKGSIVAHAGDGMTTSTAPRKVPLVS